MQSNTSRKRRTFSDLVDVKVSDFEIGETHEYETYVEQFLAHTSAKGRSQHTVTFYRDKLTNWRKALEEIGITTDVTQLSTSTIERYVHNHVHVRGLKYTSATPTLRAVKAFANYLQSKGVIETHGFHDFVIGKGVSAPIQTFSESQVVSLLAQVDVKLFVGVRDYTIILTMLETGIRLRELCDLSVSDADLNERVLRILGKNQSYRYVPFQAKYAQVLRQYLKVRGKSDTDALFITHDDEPIKRRTVQQVLQRYGKRAGITDVRVSPHTFRHTFAKWYIQNGGDPFSLQRILGHSTMDMVRTYVNMYGKELDEAHRKFSPLNRILK